MNELVIINQSTALTTLNSSTIDLFNRVITDKQDGLDMADIVLVGANSEMTANTYRQAIASFALFLGELGLSISQVNRIHVLQFKAYLSEHGNTWGEYGHKVTPLKRVSVNKYLAGIKFLLDVMIDEDMISPKVTSSFDKIRYKQDKGKPVSGQYIPLVARQAVMTAINSLKCNDDYKAMLKALFVLLQLGLRRNEIATLKIGDFKGDTLEVLGKGGKTRVILIGSDQFSGHRDTLKTWLAFIPDNGNDKPLFYAADTARRVDYSKQIDGQAVYNLVKKLLGNYSPHDFRRTLVSDLLDSKTDYAIIQNITGHSSTEMIKRYDRRGDKATQSAMDTLVIF